MVRHLGDERRRSDGRQQPGRTRWPRRRNPGKRLRRRSTALTAGWAPRTALRRKRKLAKACGLDQLLLGGAAGNRTRRIKRRELRKCWIRLRETTRNNLDRPADTPTVLMASTRHQHQGLVSQSPRRVRTSVDALMVTAATAPAWT